MIIAHKHKLQRLVILSYFNLDQATLAPNQCSSASGFYNGSMNIRGWSQSTLGNILAQLGPTLGIPVLDSCVALECLKQVQLG